MSHPLLGDPAAMSALAGTLRRTAVDVRAHAEELAATLTDAAPGWSGPTSVRTRRRVEQLVAAARDVADACDRCGHALQVSATDLAASLADLRALEEEAASRGLEVRDGSVERAWGITGVADARLEHADDRVRENLQERAHQLAATLGRQRATLTERCREATRTIRDVGALLRG